MKLLITSDDGWRTLEEMRNQAKLMGKELYADLGGDITGPQFRALHVWCQEVADYLNDCGLDMKAVIKQDVPIDWTKHNVKEYLYKPLLAAMTGKVSTKDQDTVEPSKVADTIARHLGDKFGVVLPLWPDRKRGEA